MKKSIFALAMAFGVTSAFAQDLTSKKGEPFLPETDDWSIGVEATPFLNYLGNFFGKTANNTAPTWNNYGANQTIVGKMFKDEKTAYRATVRLGMRSQSWKAEIAQPVTTAAVYPTAPTVVEDKAKASSSFIGIGVGMEKRRGKTRLQGIYGAEIFIWYTSAKSKMTYGNALTLATAPLNVDADVNSTDFSANLGYANISAVPNAQGFNETDARLLSRKFGKEFGLGVRAFIGAEYFIVPKISLAGEFGWGIGFAKGLKEKQSWEAEGTNATSGTESIATVEKVIKGGSRFIIDTDNNPTNNANYNLALSPSGALRLNFHF